MAASSEPADSSFRAGKGLPLLEMIAPDNRGEGLGDEGEERP